MSFHFVVTSFVASTQKCASASVQTLLFVTSGLTESCFGGLRLVQIDQACQCGSNALLLFHSVCYEARYHTTNKTKRLFCYELVDEKSFWSLQLAQIDQARQCGSNALLFISFRSLGELSAKQSARPVSVLSKPTFCTSCER
jgi:hypothetical protein